MRGDIPLRPTSNRPRFPRLVAVGASATLMAGLAVMATTASASGGQRAAGDRRHRECPSRQPLRAAPRPCAGRPAMTAFQCATARVPLDYRHPRGTTIGIAVVRHLTAHRARQARTLFVNAGGPTGADRSLHPDPNSVPFPARAAGAVQHRRLRHARPRPSGAVRCFLRIAAAENKFLAGLPPFPVGARQVALWERTWAPFDAQCARKNGRLLRHDTTADVARDMNLAAPGDGYRQS